MREERERMKHHGWKFRERKKVERCHFKNVYLWREWLFISFGHDLTAALHLIGQQLAAACQDSLHFWSRTNSLPVLHINFKLDTLAFLFLFSVDLSACPALELASTYWRSTSFQCWTPAPPLLLWDYSQWRKKKGFQIFLSPLLSWAFRG